MTPLVLKEIFGWAVAFLKQHWVPVLAFAAGLLVAGLSCSGSKETAKVKQTEEAAMTEVGHSEAIREKEEQIIRLRQELKKQKDRKVTYERVARELPNGKVVYDIKRTEASSESEVQVGDEMRETSTIIEHLRDELAVSYVQIKKLEIEADRWPQLGGWGLAFGARAGNVQGFWQDGVDKLLDFSAGPAFGIVSSGAILSGNILLSMPRPIAGGTQEIPVMTTLQVLF